MVGPIVSQSLSDVFCDNEYGPNFLFRNNGDGTFTDVAQQAGKGNMYNLEDHSLRSVHSNTQGRLYSMIESITLYL